MSIPTSTRAWILKKKPEDKLDVASTFAVEERPLAELTDGKVLVKVLYLSNDPAQRTWISASVVPDRAYGPCPQEGDAMPSAFLGKVVATKSAKFEEGSLVKGFGSWSEYLVLSEAGIQPAQYPKNLPESSAISTLGLTAMTAWVGLHRIGQIKKEHTVVISGAAGATGSAAVQIAKKLVGCKRVVGIAGGKEKCEWVKKLGADECLDYRSSTFAEDLAKATEGYVDVYYDNVGGSILNLMFKRMARFSRIIACGFISAYDSSDAVDLSNFFEVISMRITVQGFIVTDNAEDFPSATNELTKAIENGTFIVEGTEHKVEASFDEVPKTWQLLFSGGNTGKLITQLK
ncbi:hypothetical protein JCM8097_003312 [Rhodosporidiobolus ruineniae]